MFDQSQLGMAQVIKKPPRIADPGHRVNCGVAESGQRGADLGIVQVNRNPAVQRHEIFAVPGCAVAHHEVNFTQPGGRFTQRPSRQASAIAQAAYPIHHRNFQVALQSVML